MEFVKRGLNADLFLRQKKLHRTMPVQLPYIPYAFSKDYFLWRKSGIFKVFSSTELLMSTGF